MVTVRRVGTGMFGHVWEALMDGATARFITTASNSLTDAELAREGRKALANVAASGCKWCSSAECHALATRREGK